MKWSDLIEANKEKLEEAGMIALKDSLYTAADPIPGTAYTIAVFLTAEGDIEAHYLKGLEKIPGEGESCKRVVEFKERIIDKKERDHIRGITDTIIPFWISIKIDMLRELEGGAGHE